MLDWLSYALLLLISVVGLAVAVVGLPGIWLIVVAAIGYALFTGGVYIGLWGIVVLIALGVIAEVLEGALGGVAAGKAGASKRGMVGAIVGGLLGAILGTPLIPIPVVGTLIGAIVGAGAGAFAVEKFWLKRDTEASLKIGGAAAAGRLAGMITKLIFGGLMLITVAVWALPLGGNRPPTTLPTTLPATAPTTLPAAVTAASPETQPAALPTPPTSAGPATAPATAPAP
jgi:uncharacterized protein YqgC (DUF456 family)